MNYWTPYILHLKGKSNSSHQTEQCDRCLSFHFAGDKSVMGLMGLRYFFATKGAENLSGSAKEVDALKMPETLVSTKFMPIRAKSLSLSRFEAILTSFFV
ncbi:hypothetical protein MiSe_00550 [Microseira wollei NIES-4236]|uniref:Uncharacterized protein n=1 Tax=Microseira wollei NIES-4236 TaxID=2530354 RepID=A0AAV3X0C6_9CYAN|nr:hypothetical protein MiSe_00550 [Microseira wollei NIES-4236]